MDEGELLLEEYFNGASAARKANVKSVSKSVMSALVGIAIERGHIEGVDQPLADFYDDSLDSGKRAITIGNLLSMQAGLETTSFYNYGAWVVSDDWVAFALDQPVRSPPGTRMRYSSGNFHSEELKVEERFTAQSPYHLLYEVTIEDPKVFTRPWKMKMPLYRRVDDNVQLLEFKCVEFAEELMYGHLRKQPSGN